MIPGPSVLVSLRIEGSLTAEQVTQKVQQQLVAAVADSIGVPSALVQLLSFSNARRRLLALDLILRILAANAEEANILREMVQRADIQVYTCVSL